MLLFTEASDGRLVTRLFCGEMINGSKATCSTQLSPFVMEIFKFSRDVQQGDSCKL